MRANHRRDTRPELAVRRILHSQGHRYRVDYPPLGGRRRADVVFTRLRLAVFIDGCFWHSCPVHFVAPKRNHEYWEPKLQCNVERDRETNALLADAGWRVLRFWEHESAVRVATEIAESIAQQRVALEPGNTKHG